MSIHPPPSGLWRGSAVPVTLARQGACGGRVRGRSGKADPLWAVLFFDEDTVCGHAKQADELLSITGWWGPAKHLQPAVAELAETELWEAGETGLHLRVHRGKVEESCFAWYHEGTILGFGRYEGG